MAMITQIGDLEVYLPEYSRIYSKFRSYEWLEKPAFQVNDDVKIGVVPRFQGPGWQVDGSESWYIFLIKVAGIEMDGLLPADMVPSGYVKIAIENHHV